MTASKQQGSVFFLSLAREQNIFSLVLKWFFLWGTDGRTEARHIDGNQRQHSLMFKLKLVGLHPVLLVAIAMEQTGG